MKIIFTAATLLCASAITAQADSFTFSGTGQITDQVMVPVAGSTAPVGGAHGTSTFTAMFSSGRSLKAKAECAQWTAQPGSMFSGEGACSDTDSDGTWSTAFSCAGDLKSGSGDCWGRLTGITGKYVNKVGTVVWHSTSSNDGKDLSFSGTGMWND